MLDILSTIGLFLYIALASGAAGFFTSCCCPAGTNFCAGECTDVPPAEATVTIAGMVDAICSSCSSYNTTYIVPNFGANCCTCTYLLRFVGACNTDVIPPITEDDVQVAIGNDGAGNTRVTVTLHLNGLFAEIYQWQTGSLGSRPITCQAIGAQTATYVARTGTGPYQCDSDGSSVSVTL